MSWKVNISTELQLVACSFFSTFPSESKEILLLNELNKAPPSGSRKYLKVKSSRNTSSLSKIRNEFTIGLLYQVTFNIKILKSLHSWGWGGGL